MVLSKTAAIGEPITDKQFYAAFEYTKFKRDGTSSEEVMIFDQGKVGFFSYCALYMTIINCNIILRKNGKLS